MYHDEDECNCRIEENYYEWLEATCKCSTVEECECRTLDEWIARLHEPDVDEEECV